MGHGPGLAQNVQGVELEGVQIKLDRAPGVRGDQITEVVGQLRGRQVVDWTANGGRGLPELAPAKAA